MNNDSAGSGAAAAEFHLRRMAKESSVGTALPSTRQLQRKFSISALTAQRVLADLSRAGVLDVQPGRGSYVAQPPSTVVADLSWQTAVLGCHGQVHPLNSTVLLTPPAEGVRDLRLGYLDPGLQPDKLLGAAVVRAARRPYIWDRVPVEGLPELRSLLGGLVGPNYAADNVLITSGGQAALSLAFRALAGPGDTVLFEHLTYPGAVAAARAAGLTTVPVLADANGIVPEALDDALRRTSARLVYLQPRYSNPTGSVLLTARRPAILQALRANDAFCIEDDFVQPLDLSGPSPASLASLDDTGHVVHLQSLSKPVAPGMRIAAVTSAGAATVRLRRYRIVDDLFVAPLMQQAALELLTSPGWTRHLAGLRRELAARRDALLSALQTNTAHAQSIRAPQGGINVWWPLPAGVDEEQFTEDAYRAGIAIGAGSAYVLGDPPGPAVRLTYGRASVAHLAAAGRTLADLVEQTASRPALSRT